MRTTDHKPSRLCEFMPPCFQVMCVSAYLLRKYAQHYAAEGMLSLLVGELCLISSSMKNSVSREK